MTYKVIINAEEQYSIWPADREVPFGWDFEGTEGSTPAPPRKQLRQEPRSETPAQHSPA